MVTEQEPWACVGKTCKDMEAIGASVIRNIGNCPRDAFDDALQEFMLGALVAVQSDAFDASRSDGLNYVVSAGVNAMGKFVCDEIGFRVGHELISAAPDVDSDRPIEAIAASDPTPYERAATREVAEMLSDAVECIIAKITPKKSQCIARDYFMGADPQTVIARRYDVSWQWVSQVILQTAARLRKVLRAAVMVKGSERPE